MCCQLHHPAAQICFTRIIAKDSLYDQPVVTIQSWGGAVARQPKEPSYTETTVVLVLVFVFVIVIVIVIIVVIVTPLWDCSYPIATPARPATLARRGGARKRGGIQSEGQDAG